MLKMIISGGQTGADEAGLMAAKAHDIPTGGMAPKNYWTEKGSNYELRDVYGLTESPVMGYTHRTKENVKNSDGTVLFGDMTSSGSRSTIELCVRYKKPYIVNPNGDQLAAWIVDKKVEKMNVAGNRGSILGTQKFVDTIQVISMAIVILNSEVCKKDQL
jgi:hypothetical protein